MTAGFNSIEEQLLASRLIDEESGCWRWTKGHDEGGGGHVAINRKLMRVNRVAYDLWIDEIPEGFYVTHTTDDGICYPDCFNPEHLMLISIDENQSRASAMAMPTRGEDGRFQKVRL